MEREAFTYFGWNAWSSSIIPFAVLYNKLLKKKINTSINKKKFFKKSSVYFSYFLFHLLIIYSIIFVICKFLNFNLNSFNAFFSGLIVITNDLVVSFFWQTHSSFLLILLYLLYLFYLFLLVQLEHTLNSRNFLDIVSF